MREVLYTAVGVFALLGGVAGAYGLTEPTAEALPAYDAPFLVSVTVNLRGYIARVDTNPNRILLVVPSPYTPGESETYSLSFDANTIVEQNKLSESGVASYIEQKYKNKPAVVYTERLSDGRLYSTNVSSPIPQQKK